MSRRAEIAMPAGEAAAFLDQGGVGTCATLGRDGRPHLMPLRYAPWTYRKPQKVGDLRRDARCTLQVEAGSEYSELGGVMLACEAVIHDDIDVVAALGAEIAARHGGADLTPELAAAMRAQAAKRAGLQFVERRRASWDHRKLRGTY